MFFIERVIPVVYGGHHGARRIRLRYGPGRAERATRIEADRVDRLRKTTKALVAALEEFEKTRHDGAARVVELSASTSGAERMAEVLDASGALAVECCKRLRWSRLR
jgi:hypothetical protein